MRSTSAMASAGGVKASTDSLALAWSSTASIEQAERWSSTTDGGAADVSGTEIEGVAGDADANGVKELSVKDFDADDGLVAGGDELLHEGCGVHAEGESIFVARRDVCGESKLLRCVETLDASAGAADVGLDDNGKTQAFGSGRGVLGAMNSTGAREGQAEGVKESKL